mgnify:CR=1 FL=1
MPLSGKVIERLSLYRRILTDALKQNDFNIYSHDLAERAAVTAAQVRRDLMAIGFAGAPRKGYEVNGLLRAISDFLYNPQGEPVALVGVGNLGRALLPFFAAHEPEVRVCAAFDTDAHKTGRVIHGCRVYPQDKLEEVVRDKNIRVAILAVPADAAQRTALRLTEIGIYGIMNFAPVQLQVPPQVSVENIDMTMVLEKVAFLARQSCATPTQEEKSS